ncbi:MAG TPA: GNAT family N-acetyltransferase [Bacillales bacterium]|nr:GNAT family N-acetyltransferase [Bacillales bacterium]
MNIRNVQASDYNKIIPVMNDWWGGRQMADMLPKLFFVHFRDTSFTVEDNREIVGFLVGFVSQAYPNEAYIHFVGVHPDYRKEGLGQKLYEQFFQVVKEKGCDTVRCVTSPVNKTSIAYHTRIGFQIEKGDGEVDSVPVKKDYDGEGGDRVLFVRSI